MSDGPRPCHVMALLGLTPAVVTQLVWHLVTAENRRITGLEIWTTASPNGVFGGRQQLQQLRRMWNELQDELGARADQVIEDPTDEVRLFQAAGRDLADVRTEEESAALLSQLMEAVQHHVDTLDPDVQLIGGISGGRKSMSAALMTAFTLHARSSDRLVHVCLAPDVQRALRNHPLRRDYAIPTAAWTLRLNRQPQEQVWAHDVPFPSLRDLAQCHGRSLGPWLRSPDAAREWHAQRKLAASGSATARVELDGGQWRVRALHNGESRHVPINQRQAVLLALLASSADGLAADELRKRWRSRIGQSGTQQPSSFTRYVNRLRGDLRPLTGSGVTIHRRTEAKGWRLEDASRVEVDRVPGVTTGST